MICVRSISVPIAALAMSACLAAPLAAPPAAKDVLKFYADIAEAAYTDSADTARTLKLAVDALLAKPTEDNLRAARAAWIAARIPYMQTEAYRFGNAIVDDWEGKVNSWPLRSEERRVGKGGQARGVAVQQIDK